MTYTLKSNGSSSSSILSFFFFLRIGVVVEGVKDVT